jgi:hypothetical protein
MNTLPTSRDCTFSDATIDHSKRSCNRNLLWGWGDLPAIALSKSSGVNSSASSNRSLVQTNDKQNYFEPILLEDVQSSTFNCLNAGHDRITTITRTGQVFCWGSSGLYTHSKKHEFSEKSTAFVTNSIDDITTSFSHFEKVTDVPPVVHLANSSHDQYAVTSKNFQSQSLYFCIFVFTIVYLF